MVFIDLARVIALLMMIQGHTLDALLHPAYRTTTAFYVWSFSRGLTSCLFFFLAGFAFVIATDARRDRTAGVGHAHLRRLGRFAVFLMIGYGLHWPVAKLAHVSFMTADTWRAFRAVDALQCLAVTLALLQLMASGTRTRRQFLTVALMACVVIVVMTPAVWRREWDAWLPAMLAAYMTPQAGSQFPLFPWSAYGLLGAGAGTMYVHRWGIGIGPASMRLLPLAGATMLTASLVGSLAPWQPLGPTAFWSTSPNQFLLRAGLVCLGVGLLAQVSRRISRLPGVVNALAQESLLVYVVHLGVVYGSAWNRGLNSRYGQALTFGPAVAWVVVLWVSTATLAYSWHMCKSRKPLVAGWISQATVVTLVGQLL